MSASQLEPTQGYSWDRREIHVGTSCYTPAQNNNQLLPSTTTADTRGSVVTQLTVIPGSACISSAVPTIRTLLHYWSWGPSLVQGQEVKDVPDALLLLLNTAISWEPADSTVPPRATEVCITHQDLSPPMAAPSPSRVPARKRQAETYTARQHLKETPAISVNKPYLPARSFKGYSSRPSRTRCHTTPHNFRRQHALSTRCKWALKQSP